MKHKPTLAVSFFALALALSGCGQLVNDHITYATWRNAPPNAQPQVSAKPARLDISFSGDDSTIDAGNQSALNEFLASNRIVNGNTVDLAIGPVQQGEGAIVVKRVNAVEAELARRGITVDSIRGLPDGQPGTVSILGRMVTVIPPACPGYNAPSHMDTESQPVVNTGCSNEANLDAMVANPADLAGGRPLPPAMGEANALNNQRYNEGKVPVLPGPIVTTSQ